MTPKKMSVVEAAKLIGFSRPSVSNFLNGKVSATPEMAARIERAFNVPAQKLLDMQAAFDAAQAKVKGTPASARSYVPPFLAIKANDIEHWASTDLRARTRLAVLLRTLVNSTGVTLKKVDFPGNDDGERPGWDGYVETDEGTPWIPAGESGWEFGVTGDIRAKAEGDFGKSVKSIPKTKRERITFVFVTPRRWRGKADWVAATKAKGFWKDVRAYDASDLEQWFEQSIAGQAWFASETHRPSQGVKTLDQCWTDWVADAGPSLPPELFRSAIQAARATVLSHLSKPPERPILVAADSVEEAVAFLSQFFSDLGGDEFSSLRDKVILFDELGVLPRLAQGAQNFIAVAKSRDIERELAPFVRTLHSFVIYPRNAANGDPDVVLEPVPYQAFSTALEGIKNGRDEVDRLVRSSGRSLTVLRRQMSKVPAIRSPQWAADSDLAASLVPFLLAGAWNSENESDQELLVLLAEADGYAAVERQVQRLARLNDSPVWSVGSFRGVISKIDLLFAISGAVSTADLQRYLSLAKIILSEDDPSLDLPDNDRWAAAVRGKIREFSSALRSGICETLVLLSVHGDELFRPRLGFDAEGAVARLIRDLLTPLTSRTLEANDRDLPTYAEAAPGEFLSILEADLASPAAETVKILKPMQGGFFGSSSRTGLLWALEGLAWNPAYLPRVALILGRLSEVDIDDNWVNKPINSLKSIFRAWMPQTAADHDQRVSAVRRLVEKYPKVGWQICVDQISMGHRTGDYSHKPRWRSDGYGYGDPFPTWTPIIAFMREMLTIVLEWKSPSREMICDLIDNLPELTGEDQDRIWQIVKEWAAEAEDADKALVREKIRTTVLSRGGKMRAKARRGEIATLTTAAKKAYAMLEPGDLITRYEWMFRQHWVDESADEVHDDQLDYQKREERIKTQRIAILKEVLAAKGFAGVLALTESGTAAGEIGSLMARDVLKKDELRSFVLAAMPPGSNADTSARKGVVFGVLRAFYGEETHLEVLHELAAELSEADLVRFVLLAPYRRSTWQTVDTLEPANRDVYWQQVAPDWISVSEAENNESIERLLLAQRPRAAFFSVHYCLEKVQPRPLYRLLADIAHGGQQPEEHYQLDQYHIDQAFQLLDKSLEITKDEMAVLEFAYIDALAQPWRDRGEGHGIPNLEKYVEHHPEIYIQAIVWMFKRKDDGQDPEDLRVPPGDVSWRAQRDYRLLEAVNSMPGHDEHGKLKPELVSKWVRRVREACSELGRLDVADDRLGKLFSAAPVGDDGVWPCEPVRDTMEAIQSQPFLEGVQVGLYNSRGVHGKDGTGNEERAIAAKYRKWSRALQYSYPFIASSILEGVARTYDNEAAREELEAGIRRRLG